MADALREETAALKDGRRLTIRPSRVDDAEGLLKNVNLVCAEDVYLLMDEIPWDLDRERAWLSEFDGIRNVLFIAALDGEIVGQADCHGGLWPKTRHVGAIGIAIRDGWREAGLGRILMERILEWMRSRGFQRAVLDVFATNARARRLYESLGFQVEGVRRKHFLIRGEYVDEISMGLWLGT